MAQIDFKTCSPVEAITFFAEDGVEFDRTVELLIQAFTKAGRLNELAPYLEPKDKP
jgi:hypothetical protein